MRYLTYRPYCQKMMYAASDTAVLVALRTLARDKTKSQIRTMTMVLFGKKKDRGRIKQEYAIQCDIVRTIMNDLPVYPDGSFF